MDGVPGYDAPNPTLSLLDGAGRDIYSSIYSLKCRISYKLYIIPKKLVYNEYHCKKDQLLVIILCYLLAQAFIRAPTNTRIYRYRLWQVDFINHNAIYTSTIIYKYDK